MTCIATLNHGPLDRLIEVGAATAARFNYDGQMVIAEHSANVLQRRYVHGPGTDEPLVWYEGSGTGHRRWLQADQRGSVKMCKLQAYVYQFSAYEFGDMAFRDGQAHPNFVLYDD